MRTPRPWALPTEPATRQLLAAAGVSSEMLVTRLRRGELVRVRHGVYLAASAWPNDPGGQHLVRARAEVAAHPGAVISRQSAALAWQLPSPGAVGWAVALADPARESAAESLSAGRFHLAGIPRPLFNPPVHTAAGTLLPGLPVAGGAAEGRVRRCGQVRGHGGHPEGEGA